MNQFKKNDVFKLVSISLLFFTGCSKIDQKVPTKPSKQQRFRDAMQHEFDKTHDPELNEIPSQRLQEALKYYEYVNDASLKSKTSPPFADIEWKERGPNNIGGRTRAILFLSALIYLENKALFENANLLKYLYYSMIGYPVQSLMQCHLTS